MGYYGYQDVYGLAYVSIYVFQPTNSLPSLCILHIVLIDLLQIGNEDKNSHLFPKFVAYFMSHYSNFQNVFFFINCKLFYFLNHFLLGQICISSFVYVQIYYPITPTKWSLFTESMCQITHCKHI